MGKVIVLITIQFYPDFGGASIRTYNVAKMLKRTGFDVYVVTTIPSYFGVTKNGNRTENTFIKKYNFFIIESIAGINTIRLKILPIPHKTLIQRLFRYIYFTTASILLLFHIAKIVKVNNKKITAIYAHFPPIISYLIGYVYSRILKCSFFIDIHDLLPEQMSTITKIKSNDILFKMLSLVAKKLYEKASCITSSSRYMSKILKERYDVPSSKILNLPTGVEAFIFCDKQRTREALINTGIIPSEWKNKKILIYTGVIDPPQGLPFLVEIFGNLVIKHEINNLVLMIVGDGKEKEKIEMFVQKNGLEKNIKILGYLPRSIVFKLICASDVGIVPLSKSSMLRVNVPTKLFEYLSFRKHIFIVSESLELYYLKKNLLDKISIFCLPKKNHVIRALKYLDNSINTQIYEDHDKKIKKLSLEFLSDKLYEFFERCLNKK